MTAKTRAQLKAENAADFPDNVSRLISPADLRGQMDDIVDSALFPEDDIEGEAGLPGPPGSDGASIDGVVALRAIAPSNGFTVRLNHHTTCGDYGSGLFRGVTTGGPYTDNDGTIIVPTSGDGSAAWLRVWDGQTAHIGWFGAKCDIVTDDYIPVKKCLGLFTTGRGPIKTGAVDIGPGFAHGSPLIIGGNVSYGIKIFGHQSHARGGFEPSQIKYIGPPTMVAIYIYGCNGSSFENFNNYPGNALNGIALLSDGTYNQTATHAITAGTNVVVTPSSMTWLQRGCFLGIDAGGDNFEIVYVTSTTSTTFTATFTKSHATGVQIGGGSAASSLKFFNCLLLCPTSPIWTTIPGAPSGGPDTVFTPASMAGIQVGMPLRIGSYGLGETIYVKSITATTFTADCAETRPAGALLMYATAAVLVGNPIVGTPQVSEMQFHNIHFQGMDIEKSYAGIRQVQGGNVKNIICTSTTYLVLRIVFALEFSSGQLIVNGAVGAGVTDTLFLTQATLAVFSLEDESLCYYLIGSHGANPINATFVGCTFQGGAPETNDRVVDFMGQLTMIGCQVGNGRVWGVSLPIFNIDGLAQGPPFPSSLSLINCHFWSVYENSPFITDNLVDILGTGQTGKVSILNCMGGVGGDIVPLPTVVGQRQNTATYDPASLATGAVGTIQTMTVSGAVLGDLVEASFSLDLQGASLRAWVSAARHREIPVQQSDSWDHRSGQRHRKGAGEEMTIRTLFHPGENGTFTIQRHDDDVIACPRMEQEAAE